MTAKLLFKLVYPFLIGFLLTSCAPDSKFSSGPKVTSDRYSNSVAQGDMGKKSTRATHQNDKEATVDPRQSTISELEAGETEVNSKEFLSSRLVNGQLEVTKNSIVSTSEVELVRNKKAVSDQHTQKKRNIINDRFEQGTAAVIEKETFTAGVDYGAVDIVVVIDNSGSMREEQEKLAPNLKSLISKVENASWQIMVVTTDSRDNPCESGVVIKKGDKNPEEAFKKAIIDAGVAGSGNEQGIYQAIKGFKCMNLQGNSSLATLIVSDEDNCSDGCTSSDEQPKALIDYMKKKSNSGKVFGIVDIPKADGTKSCTSSYKTSKSYVNAIKETKGHAGSICAKDYTKTLEAISQSISQNIDNVFTLKLPPLRKTVSVLVDDMPVNEFSVSSKTVTLAQEPAANKQVEIQYTSKASEMKSEFSLTKTVYPGSLKVEINGELQKASSYMVAHQKLKFNTQPQALAVITASYKDSTMSLDNSWNLSSTPADPDKVVVRVNNVKDSNFTINRGVLTLADVPEESATILISYEKYTLPKLSYKVFDNIENLVLLGTHVKDQPNNSIDSITLKTDGTIEIAEEDFKAGRIITIRSEVVSLNQEINLDMDIVESSLDVIESPCPISPDLFSINKGVLLVNCRLTDTPLIINFSRVTEKVSSFPLSSIPSKSTKIEVTLNGEVTGDYMIDGALLKILAELPPETRIGITETIYLN